MQLPSSFAFLTRVIAVGTCGTFCLPWLITMIAVDATTRELKKISQRIGKAWTTSAVLRKLINTLIGR